MGTAARPPRDEGTSLVEVLIAVGIDHIFAIVEQSLADILERLSELNQQKRENQALRRQLRQALRLHPRRRV